MADLTFNQSSQAVNIVGGDELYAVKVNVNEELQASDIITQSGLFGALTVGTSAVEIKVGATLLANRKMVTIYNNSNTTMYWGYSNAVTTATGTPLNKGEFLSLRCLISVWVIAGSAGNDSRVTEAK